MSMKESAWQHRSDLEQIDWKAICEQNEDPKFHEYQLAREHREAAALRQSQNKNRRRLNKINIIAGIFLAGLLIGMALELSGKKW